MMCLSNFSIISTVLHTSPHPKIQSNPVHTYTYYIHVRIFILLKIMFIRNIMVGYSDHHHRNHHHHCDVRNHNFYKLFRSNLDFSLVMRPILQFISYHPSRIMPATNGNAAISHFYSHLRSPSSPIHSYYLLSFDTFPQKKLHAKISQNILSTQPNCFVSSIF